MVDHLQGTGHAARRLAVGVEAAGHAQGRDALDLVGLLQLQGPPRACGHAESVVGLEETRAVQALAQRPGQDGVVAVRGPRGLIATSR